MVPDDTAGEARQDRRQGYPPRQLRHLPVGRGRRAETTVRADHGPNRTTTGARRSGSVLNVGKWGTQAFIRTTAAVAVRPLGPK